MSWVVNSGHVPQIDDQVGTSKLDTIAFDEKVETLFFACRIRSLFRCGQLLFDVIF